MLNKLYGVSVWPSYVLIDKEGIVVRTGLDTQDHILSSGLENSWFDDQIFKLVSSRTKCNAWR